MTAYELRIIDWSSDVCSSDLDFVGCGGQRHNGTAYAGLDQVLGDGVGPVRLNGDLQAGVVICGQALNQSAHAVRRAGQNQLPLQHFGNRDAGSQGRGVWWRDQIQGLEIGRASCRERVWQYVSISVVGVSLQKKKQ